MEQETRVVNCKYDKYDTYIGRPSIWGNPYTHHKKGTLAEFVVTSRTIAVEKYKEYILNRLKNEPELMTKFYKDIHHKTISCWCSPLLCHGDILAEISRQIDQGIDIFSQNLNISEEKREYTKRKGSTPID